VKGSEIDRDVEASQVAKWQTHLEEAKDFPKEKKIEHLWLGLKNMGYRHQFPSHSPSVQSIYTQLQETFLSLPGHAEYFAEEVERQREIDLKWPSGQRSTYDRLRAKYLRDTLRHLPSPETVRVLGRYLHDERDTPKSLAGDAPFLPENAYLACAALANIGLRIDPPLPDSGIMRWRYDVDEIRAWYAKVESGEIPFSFKGQPVEYRFLPDGTVEETPIPIPFEELAAQEAEVLALENARKPPIAPEPSVPEPEGNNALRWIAAAVVTLLVSVWWILSAARRRSLPQADNKK